MSRREILLRHWQKYQLSIGLNPNDDMSEKAIQYFEDAMEEYYQLKINEKK
jgi:hypothetical protein